MDKPRYFNKIEILDNSKIRKSSTDSHKIQAELAWYSNNTRFSAPHIYDSSIGIGYASYDMEYIHSKTLAQYFLYGGLNKKGISNALTILYEYCTAKNSASAVYTDYTKTLIESMYKDKTYHRLAETDIDLDKSYIINGVLSPSIREIIEDCPVQVQNNSIKSIHGDLCLSNILVDCNIENITLDKSNHQQLQTCVSLVKVVDPRGYLPDGKFTNIGDINYDVAKLAHSIIGRYDQIKNDSGFHLSKSSGREYTCVIDTTPCQEIFETEFTNLFSKFNYYNIMIHLFLSMIPLHKDRPEHQEKMLVNAIRLYLERETRNL